MLLLAGLALWRAKQGTTVLVVLALSGAVTAYAVRERLLPEAAELLVSAEASRALQRGALTPAEGGALLVVGFRETSLVFETETAARLLSGAEAGAAARPGDVAVVNQAQALDAGFTEGLSARGLAFEPAGAPVVGLNYSNGDDVLLQPGRIVTAPAAGPAEAARL
jgi:hypothetical protein